MENKTLHYQLSPQVVDYLLNAINKVQIVGVQAATDLLEVTKLLQNPSNKDDLQKEQYEQLKGKFEKKQKE